MPAVLTHKSIMLLARRRVRAIRDGLDQKIGLGRNVTDLERAMRDLARSCHDILSGPPRPTVELGGRAFNVELADGVSKFAVMGSMGPDIPAFGAIFKPGQSWAFDVLHKGTPDGHRELVEAGTCAFIFAFWREASQAIETARNLNDTERTAVRGAVQAYVLGHLCHVAGDVVSHPYINDVEWHLGTDGRDPFSHTNTEGSIDSRVARRVLMSPSVREGAPDWGAWWPTADDLPKFFPIFARAFAEAFRQTYVQGGRRRTGFHEREQKLAELDPPALDADFMRDAYAVYRKAVGKVYSYGKWSLFFILLLLALPLFLFPILAATLLPNAKKLFEGAEDVDRERASFELLTLPLIMGAAESLIFGLWAACHTTKHVGERVGLGMFSASAALVLGAAFFGTSTAEDVSPSVRWGLMFAPPAANSTAWLAAALSDRRRGGRKARGGLSAIYALPVGFLTVCAIFSLLFFLIKDDEDDLSVTSGWFWLVYGLWAALLLVLAFLFGRLLRDIRIPEHPKAFPVDEPHHVRLFDDGTLFADPSFPGPEGARLYPAGRRELVKLWWEGGGDLFVRSDGHRLVFRSDPASATDEQVVPAPIAPMTIAEFLGWLERNVKDPGGQAGHLRGAVMHPTDPDYELSAGVVFADHGDAERKEKTHDEKAAEFRKLAKTEDDADYVLYHATKASQAIRLGRLRPTSDLHGLTGSALDESMATAFESVDGHAYSHDPAGEENGATLMDYAGDLAAILCLGATSQMTDGPPPLARVHRVFRNWNLDRRRINEWRMLISGGAFSEHGMAPDRADSAMLRPLDPAAWRAPLSQPPGSMEALREGEATAGRMGWVNLMRAWLDMSRRPDVDPLSTESFNPNHPSNRALSRGIAFLFDRPDPTPAP